MKQNQHFYVSQLMFKIADVCDAAILNDNLTEPRVHKTLMDMATRYSPVEAPAEET